MFPLTQKENSSPQLKTLCERTRLLCFPQDVRPLFLVSRPRLVAQLCPTLRTHGLYSPWNSPGQGSLSLLQGIFPTWGQNPGLPQCRRILYQPSHQGSIVLLCFSATASNPSPSFAIPPKCETSSQLLLSTLVPSQVASRWETPEVQVYFQEPREPLFFEIHHHCKLSVQILLNKSLSFLLIPSSFLKQIEKKRKKNSTIEVQLIYEEEQNMPPPDMPVWHKDYLGLVIFKKQQTQAKF